MNTEIEGKMTSDVRGLDEVSAAAVKELKATSTGRMRSEQCIAGRQPYGMTKVLTGNTTP
jgi:hypothetical protein